MRAPRAAETGGVFGCGWVDGRAAAVHSDGVCVCVWPRGVSATGKTNTHHSGDLLIIIELSVCARCTRKASEICDERIVLGGGGGALRLKFVRLFRVESAMMAAQSAERGGLDCLIRCAMCVCVCSDEKKLTADRHITCTRLDDKLFLF